MALLVLLDALDIINDIFLVVLLHEFFVIFRAVLVPVRILWFLDCRTVAQTTAIHFGGLEILG